MKHFWVLLTFCFFSFSDEKVAMLYRSLNPSSISEHLAFYHLFPDSNEGQKALADAWKLLCGSGTDLMPINYLPDTSVSAIVTLVTKGEGVKTSTLSSSDYEAIQKLGKHLPNRNLKGYLAKSEEEVLALAADEIDLSTGLLLAQSSDDPFLEDKIQSYHALLDLMALQILTQVKITASPKEKIRAINRFIFEEMGYRFPPHSIYAKDIDLYTYLPSVIDSRRGVCLGVSILYLCLSQRLDLPLEAVTPPGHIFVRHCTPEMTCNIETTARGIHLDTEEYLGIETEELEVKNIKEVIGLAYFNEASVHWQNENYPKALKCYQKALLYLPDDLLLKELMGYNYLFVGETEKGRKLLEEVYKSEASLDSIAQRGVLEDFLNNKVDGEGIRTLYLHVDEKRESVLLKREKLEKLIEKWPNFRAGYFHLAVTWLQLNRQKEALKALIAYEKREPKDPTSQYFLAELYAASENYPKAWEHLHKGEELLKDRENPPKTLRAFHRELARRSPE